MTAALLNAFYLGFLCSISPCPLAANIAAVSFIARKSGKKTACLYTGFLYASGRLFTFVLLGLILSRTFDAVPAISHGLQKYMNMFLGPCLILIAMLLLELLSLPRFKSIQVNEKFLRFLDSAGYFGAFLLGIIFALSFCPTSAVLYFGTLLPLSVKMDSPLLFSFVFGFSSCVPILIFAFISAFFSSKLAKACNAAGHLERWAQRITGIIFLLLGLWFTGQQILQ